MAQATAPNLLPESTGEYYDNIPLAAAVTIYAGQAVAKDAAGRLVDAGDANATVTLGIAPDTYDNSAGAAGAVTGSARRGRCKTLNNSTVTPVTQAMIGTLVWLENGSTAKGAIGSTPAGLTVKFLGFSTQDPTKLRCLFV